MISQIAPLTIKPKPSVRLSVQRAGFTGIAVRDPVAQKGPWRLDFECAQSVSPLDSFVREQLKYRPTSGCRQRLFVSG